MKNKVGLIVIAAMLLGASATAHGIFRCRGRLVGAATNEVAVESNGYIEDITLETASGDIAKVFLWTDEMEPVDMVCNSSDSI